MVVEDWELLNGMVHNWARVESDQFIRPLQVTRVTIEGIEQCYPSSISGPSSGIAHLKSRLPAVVSGDLIIHRWRNPEVRTARKAPDAEESVRGFQN
jgi:hypothetical protein